MTYDLVGGLLAVLVLAVLMKFMTDDERDL